MIADTIVVGAGAAGAVIAARLSELSSHRVLLLEAGPDRGAELPRDLRDGTRNSMTDHDWGFRFTPTDGGPVWPFPRGKVVGGSSAVNTCIALRGSPRDYDEWAAMGLDEWSFERCLPAFRRLERDLDFTGPWHGAEGPVPIRRHTDAELSTWQAAFVEACLELGFSRCPDHNDPTMTGVGPHAMNKIGGERMGAGRCYLSEAVRARPNLCISPHTLVRRVLFERRRAVGVEVERDGQIERLLAPRVVLCGGAIATPGILLRSGVGPRAVVERLGVDLVADVPAVGARLLDHPGAAFIMVPARGVCRTSDPLIQTLLRFTSSGSALADDMQLQPGSFVPITPGLDLPAVSVMCSVGKPRGHGRLTFGSADPHEKPRIETRALVDPHDRKKAVEALRIGFAATRTRAMRKLAFAFWPGLGTLKNDDATERWIMRSCGSGYHPCGTVPMGPEGSPDAACDGRGRVRGTEGLIAADASIFPTIMTSNTHVPTLMVGERFGEWLREG